jgi:hypothetical protein
MATARLKSRAVSRVVIRAVVVGPLKTLEPEWKEAQAPKDYCGPQVPSGALPAAEPTPIATGCDDMPW